MTARIRPEESTRGPLQALVGRRLIARRPMNQTANESGRIHYTTGPWRLGVSGAYGA
jgi:hypothetical protein